MPTPTRDYPWRFSIFLAAYYTSNALYQGYVSVYLGAVGMTTQQIGYIMAIVPVCTIISQPLWGAMADRSPDRTRVLRLMTILSGAFALLLGAFHGFFPLLLVVGAFSASYPALQPLGDAIILESLGEDRPFGPLRTTACLAFALSALASGWLLQGRMSWFPLMTCAIMVVVTVSTFSLPHSPGHPRGGRKATMLSVLKLPHMKGLLALFMVLQLTLGYYFAFFPIYFTTQLGGSEWLLGLSYLISSLSELPFLLFSDKLFERLGAGKLLCLASFVMGARWLLLSFAPPMGIVLASQVLHGGGFIVLTVAMAKYIARSVPDALRARGQMVLSICGYGLSRVVGNLVGGLIGGAYGLSAGFLVAAAVCAVALLAAPRYLKLPPLNGAC